MIEFLKSAIETSTGSFSSPNEIKRFYENLTGDSLTTNSLSGMLKTLGWVHSGSYQRISRDGTTKSSFYHRNDNSKLRLLLKDSAIMDNIEPSNNKTLVEINYEFLSARASKESNLAVLRKNQSDIAELHKADIARSAKIRDGEYVKLETAQREIDLALIQFQNELDTLPLSLAPTFASINSEEEIEKILEKKIFHLLTNLSKIDITLPD